MNFVGGGKNIGGNTYEEYALKILIPSLFAGFDILNKLYLTYVWWWKIQNFPQLNFIEEKRDYMKTDFMLRLAKTLGTLVQGKNKTLDS